MEHTWASGSVELLNHAESHMHEETALDKRLAFISIDNAVEISIRTFLSLPARYFGAIKPSRKEVESASNSFPLLVDLLVKYTDNRLVGIDPMDIEFYHRIRNKLYHDGTGLAVDDNHISAYFTIAKLLIEKLFEFAYTSKITSTKPTLEDVVLIWNNVEKQLEELFYLAGLDDEGTYKWEAALTEQILTFDQISRLTELRMERNRLVHSTKIDKNELSIVLEKAKNIYMELINQVGKLEEMQNI